VNGYFEHNGGLGKLTVTGFKFMIKGLNSDFREEFEFEVKQWDKLLSLCEKGAPIKSLLCNFLTAKREGLSENRVYRLLSKTSAS